MSKYRRRINPRQARFIEEYLKDMNAHAAALRAGFAPGGAKAHGCRLLVEPLIQQAIAEAMEARSQRTGIDADWVLRRLAEESEADIADIFDDKGNLRPVKEWPRVWRTGLVTGIESIEEYAGRGSEREAIGLVRKIKLSDRIRHKELIGKHVNVQAFREQLEVSGKLSIADEIRKRRAERSS